MYEVHVCSKDFQGLRTLAQHQLINEVQVDLASLPNFRQSEAVRNCDTASNFRLKLKTFLFDRAFKI